MNYSTYIKEKLVSLINEMDHYHWLFTRNAEKDFSRIKKWSFGEIMRFIICMEGKSLKDELLEHFNFSVDNSVAGHESGYFHARCSLKSFSDGYKLSRCKDVAPVQWQTPNSIRC